MQSQNNYYVSNFMDLSKYKLVRAELDDKWDNFIRSSDSGTIFSSKVFLESFSEKFGLWYCLKNNQIKAAIILVETDDGKSCKRLGFMVHTGIVLAPELPEANTSQTYPNL